MPLWSNGPLFDWCWFLRNFLTSNLSKLMLPLSSFMLLWRWWKCLCEYASWFQAAFKWKVQGSLSQENSLQRIKVLVLFRNILMRNFGNCSLPQASFDPCLFIGKMDIDICYVDDLIFWARNEDDIVELAIQLHAKGVDLEQEDNAVWFLGVHIKCNPNTGLLNMTQKGLIKQVLEILGLNVGTANGKFTPAKESLLPNMCMDSLPLEISTTVVWLECFCIFLVTHTLTLLMLSTVLQDICSAQS